MIYYIGKALASIILVKLHVGNMCCGLIICLRTCVSNCKIIFNYMHSDSKYLNRNAAILTVYTVPYIDMLFMNLYSNTQTF